MPKRPVEEVEAVEPGAKKTKVAKSYSPVLVVLPGAGGSIALDMQQLVLAALAQPALFQPAAESRITVRVSKEKLHWNKANAGAAKNFQIVDGLLPDGEFFVMGNSFGNRVICEMLAANAATPNGMARCKGAILCGFPLHGPKIDPKRAQQLQKLPSDARVLVVSGTEDEFLHREHQPAGERGEAALRVVFESLRPADKRLVMVEAGQHTLPGCKGKGAKAAKEKAASTIIDLVRAFCSP